MRIAADGTWFYGGSPIGRPALVKLFASILRKEGDRHVLVTPVERVGITVDDAPFVAVEMEASEAQGVRRLAFRTNVDDVVTVDAEHPLRFEPAAAEGIKPYVRVRGGLWALVKRALYYDLVALGEVAPRQGEDWFGVSERRKVLPDRPRQRDRGTVTDLPSPAHFRRRPAPAGARATRRRAAGRRLGVAAGRGAATMRSTA